LNTGIKMQICYMFCIL